MIKQIFLLTIFGYSAFAASIEIKDVWARPSLEGRNTAIYFKIHNKENADIAIEKLSIKSDLADKIELHQSYFDSATQSNKMTAIDRLLVPALQEVEMKPGGLHVMLMKLKHDISVGDKVNFSIYLSDDSVVDLEAEVK